MVEHKTAQLRIKRKAILPEGAAGTIFWATPSRARLLLDAGAVELLNAEQPAVGPAETKPAGPTETKEPHEKKFFAAAQAGPSTDSASLSQPGAVAQSSVLQEAQVLPVRKSRRSKKQAAEPSQSMTATE
jgi:hypothetical protein